MNKNKDIIPIDSSNEEGQEEFDEEITEELVEEIDYNKDLNFIRKMNEMDDLIKFTINKDDSDFIGYLLDFVETKQSELNEEQRKSYDFLKLRISQKQPTPS